MSTLRKFYGQFNNIMSVLGKGSYEMNAIHLVKTNCLPTLTYGCENAVFCENMKQKINPCNIFVVSYQWHTTLIRINCFSGKKMYTSDNLILNFLSCLVLNRFAAIGSQHGVTSILQPAASIKVAVWNTFAVACRHPVFVFCYVMFLLCTVWTIVGQCVFDFYFCIVLYGCFGVIINEWMNEYY